MTKPIEGQLLGAGRVPAPGGWRSALYRDDAPGAVLDSQPWARDWRTFMRALNDPNDATARRFIGNAMSERLPSEGGFLVPEALRSQVFAYLAPAIIRPRSAAVYPMSTLRLSVPVLDNLSQASGKQALGGLTFAVTEEGAGITPTTPAVERLVLEARKIAAYLEGVPDEFADDAAGAFSDFLARVIGLGYAWEEDDLFISGTGVGEPQGLVNAACAVAVTRANSGQAPVDADVIAMFKALAPPSKQHGLTPGVTEVAWLVSASVMDALLELYYLPAGASPTSGAPVSVPSWFSMGDGDKIAPSFMGLPAIVTDHQPAAGTAGDLILADLRHYAIGDRMALTIERSRKGAGFVTGTSNWRVKSRVDGRYQVLSSYTTGANQVVSPVVVLH